jgi:hypothetical protein
MEENINKIGGYINNIAIITMIKKTIPRIQEGDMVVKISSLVLKIYNGSLGEFEITPNNDYMSHFIAKAAENKILELLEDAVKLAKEETALLGEQSFDESAKFVSEYKIKKEYLESL